MITIIVFLHLLVFVNTQNSKPIVKTAQGQVLGAKAKDGSYLVFYGIPYAGSVSGVRRFKAAPKPSNYPKIFSATNEKIICAQPSSKGLIGTEDCLTLNIFTNNLSTRKPVLVWLEGEGYATNEAVTHSYKNLIDGFVVVTINYRLSIFGFLCLGVKEAPGNAGLKDAVQGLKWIKSNIAGFGGNPNNIVLFGHGSGAAMADLITLSPLAEYLVHKAVVVSGSALAPWAVSYDPIGLANAVGAKLGYGGESPANLAKRLLTTNAGLLVSTINQFPLFRNDTFLFTPCVENTKLKSTDILLHDAPINILKNGNYKKIPYIAGYVNKEGTLRAPQAVLGSWISDMPKYFTDFLPVDLNFKTESTRQSEANKIRQFYFGKSTIFYIDDFIEYQGDILVVLSVIRGAILRSTTSPGNVFLYEMTFKGLHNSDWPYQWVQLNGVRHGAILNYFLNVDLKPKAGLVMKNLIDRHIAFANTGNILYHKTMPDFLDIDTFLNKDDLKQLDQLRWPWKEMHFILSDKCNGYGLSTNDNSNRRRNPTYIHSTTWLATNDYHEYYLLYSGREGPIANTTIYSYVIANKPHRKKRNFWKEFYDKYYIAPTPVSSQIHSFEFGSSASLFYSFSVIIVFSVLKYYILF